MKLMNVGRFVTYRNLFLAFLRYNNTISYVSAFNTEKHWPTMRTKVCLFGQDRKKKNFFLAYALYE